jgi:hypothetical protein
MLSALREFGRKLLGKPRWDGPDLYPGVDASRVSRYLAADEAVRIRGLPRLMILPFEPEPGDEDTDTALLSFAISRVLGRDLMLLSSLSVRGAEETPASPLSAIRRGIAELQQGETQVLSGTFRLEPGRFHAQVELIPTDGESVTVPVQADDLTVFFQRLARGAAYLLGLKIPPAAEAGWATGRPPGVETLLAYAPIAIRAAAREEDDPALDAEAIELWNAHPEFSLPLHLINPRSPGVATTLLEGCRRDPFDAHLHFLTFCALWNSEGPQREALQFCRRALDLSPGHGKAHMCLPHAAPPHRDLLRHSELAYHLLPGNPAAVNNLILYLRRAGGQEGRLLELAREGIENDPYDPGPRYRLIELLEAAGHFQEALIAARELRRLYGPPMEKRTRQRLEQHPRTRADLASGRLDPVRHADTLIAELEKRLKKNRAKPDDS